MSARASGQVLINQKQQLLRDLFGACVHLGRAIALLYGVFGRLQLLGEMRLLHCQQRAMNTVQGLSDGFWILALHRRVQRMGVSAHRLSE